MAKARVLYIGKFKNGQLNDDVIAVFNDVDPRLLRCQGASSATPNAFALARVST